MLLTPGADRTRGARPGLNDTPNVASLQKKLHGYCSPFIVPPNIGSFHFVLFRSPFAVIQFIQANKASRHVHFGNVACAA